MATKARVAITAENQMSKGLLESKKAMVEWQQSVQKISKAVSTAFNVTAIAASFKVISNAVGSCVKDFTEADRKYKQLSLTLGNGKAFQQASATIAKLSKLTLASKDEIESMVSELAALGKSSEEIDNISSAAVSLSNVTGRDLNSSMTTLLNTYKGTTTQLNKLGIQTSQFTKEQLQSGAAIDLVNEKFGKLSEDMAKGDFSQSWKNIKDNLGDVKQSLGDIAAFSFSGLIKGAEEFSEKLNSGFNEFIQNFKLIVPQLPAIIAKLNETVKGAFTNLISVDGVKSTANLILNVVQSALKGVVSAIANLGEYIVSSTTSILSGLKDYITYWIMSVCDEVGINVSDLLNTIYNWLTDTKVGAAVDSVVSAIVNDLKIIPAQAGSVFKYVGAVIDEVASTGTSLWTKIKNAVLSFASIATGTLAGVANVIRQGLEELRVGIANLFGPVIGWIKNASSNVGKFFNYVGALVKNLVSSSGIEAFFQKVGILLSTLGSNIKEVVRYVKDNISALLKQGGVDTFFTNIGIAIANEASNIKRAFEYVGDILAATFSSANLSNIFSNLGKWADTIKENFKNIFVYIGEVMKAIFSWDNIKSVAIHMVESFLNFFVDKINALIEKLPKILKIDTIERVSLTDEKYQSPLSKLNAPTWQSAMGSTTKYDPYAQIADFVRTEAQFVSATEDAAESIKPLTLATADFSGIAQKATRDITAPQYSTGSGYTPITAEEVTSRIGQSLNELSSRLINLRENPIDLDSLEDRIDAISKPIIEKYSGENAAKISDALAVWQTRATDSYLESASEQFTSVGEYFTTFIKDSFGDSWDAISDVAVELGDFATEAFGSDFAEFGTWFNELFDGLKKETKATQAVATGINVVSEQGASIVEIGSTIAEKTDNVSLYEKLKQTLFGYNAKVTTYDEEGKATTVDQWMSGTFSMSESDATELAGMFDSLIDSMGIFGDMLIGINPLIAALKPVIEGFISVMAPMIEAILLPLQSTLTYIGELMAGLFAPILDKLAPVFQFIANILAMVIQPILALIQSPLIVIAALLTILEPIINLVGEAFQYLMIPLNAFAATIQWVGAWIKFIILGIYNAFSWIWGGTVENEAPESWSSYYNALKEKTTYTPVEGTDLLSEISNGLINGTSTSTGVSNASYSGGGSVTMNIYVNAPVVGSAGMEEFAIMLRKEFEAIGYYNVA